MTRQAETESNTAVVSAIREHLDEGSSLHILDLMPPVKRRFVAELFSTLPAHFAADARIQFCPPPGAAV